MNEERCDTCGHLYGSDDDYFCQYCRPERLENRVDVDEDEMTKKEHDD